MSAIEKGAAESARATARAAGDGPVCVYIASRGHSGSTLLELLLGGHADIASAGEIANLGLQCLRDEGTSWSGRCGCGQSPFDCPVWSLVFERIEREHGIDMKDDPLAFRVSDIGLEQENPELGRRRHPASWLRRKLWRLARHHQYAGPAWIGAAMKLYEPQRVWARNRSFVLSALSEIRGVRAVVDSSKDPLGMRDMYDHSPLPVKILFLTRDCRGNVWSFAKRNGFEGGRAETLTRAARDWAAVNERIRHLLGRVPTEDWIHVKYEDLCSAPEATLRKVFGFIGVEFDPAVLEGREHVEHTIAGNRIRLTNAPMKINEDTAWRENLSGEDLAVIDAVAGPLSRSLGYDE